MSGPMDRAALLVIDVQLGFDEPRLGHRNNPQAEENVGRLLEYWRRERRPVYHTQHMSTEPNSPLRPERPGNKIKPVAKPAPGEPVIPKTVNSAFIGTDLEARLRNEAIDTLVIVGITTDHCVSTTARMAGNLGFRTFVVSDAMFTFDRVGPDGVRHKAEDVQAVTLASLHGEFATVLTSSQLLAEAFA